MTITATTFWLEGVGDFTAAAGSRGAMKTAKSQVGRPRGWVRAPIVQTGMIRAMMRGCGVALLGSSPLDLRLCRPHHMYICNECLCKLSQCLGAKCSPRGRFGFGEHERECEVRWRRPDPTSSRRCVRAYRNTTHIHMMGPAKS